MKGCHMPRNQLEFWTKEDYENFNQEYIESLLYEIAKLNKKIISQEKIIKDLKHDHQQRKTVEI